MKELTNLDFAPGDLVAFSGRDWLSRLIKAATCPPWYWFRAHWRAISHIGICCRAPNDFARHGACALIEATNLSTLPNLFDIRPRPTEAAPPISLLGEHRPAPLGARWPEDRANHYPGFVYRARLSPLWALDSTEAERLQTFLLDLRGRQYDFLGALRAGLGRAADANLSRLFCSEVVAAVLARLQRLRESDPAAWTPAALLRELVRTGVYARPERIV